MELKEEVLEVLDLVKVIKSWLYTNIRPSIAWPDDHEMGAF